MVLSIRLNSGKVKWVTPCNTAGAKVAVERAAPRRDGPARSRPIDAFLVNEPSLFVGAGVEIRRPTS